MNSQERFEDFKHERCVFVFENPDTKDWIGITMCDGEILPVSDLSIAKMILDYRGDIKCDVRVEIRTNDNKIECVRGFEWRQIHEWNRDIRYRFYYSARHNILAAEGHLWQLQRSRSSVIDALYILAAKRYISVDYKPAIRLFYKSLKLICRARIEVDEIAMVSRVGDTMVKINGPMVSSDKFYIIKPYKNVVVCRHDLVNDCCSIIGIKGDYYNIPSRLLSEFICKYF
ncbi:hypothetical protein D5b_00414 [Faustovirus]|nr:hypothetical protein D5b_00414 [Faustovirus]AMN84502.1 hypothetical protein D6_00091 [Faustovirus]AMP44356.1 hypothetical protein PRJ_Dakar_00405 [Faustovirus]